MAHPERASSWSRLQAGVLALVLLAGLVSGWRSRLPEVLTGGDEAAYVALSHSLERGQYREEWRVAAPPHAQYPPGNPVWLLAIRRVFGPDLETVRLANLLLAALTALLLADGLRRLDHPWLGVGAAAATALNPSLLWAAGSVQSETPYLALATLAVWAALRADHAPARWAGSLAVAAALAAFLTRTMGLAVVLGIGAWCLIRRRWKLAAAHAVTAAIVVGGWFWYVARAGAASGGAARTYAGDIQGDAMATSGLVARVWSNSQYYLTRALPYALGLPTIEGTPLDNLLWILVLVVCGGLGLWMLVRRWPAAGVTLLGSAGILALWPWPVDRLLISLGPLVVLALFAGFPALMPTRPGASRLRAWLPVGLGLAVAGSAALAQWERDRAWRGCDRRQPYADAACFGLEDRNLVTAARFVRDSLTPTVVVATAKPTTLFHFSGRRAELIPGFDPAGPPASAQLRSAGSDHILLSHVQPGVTQAVLADCAGFVLRAQFPPATLLLRIRDSTTEGSDACPALAAAARDTTYSVPAFRTRR